MFLICWLLIGLTAVAIAIDTEAGSVEQAEFIPVPVRVKETNGRKNLG